MRLRTIIEQIKWRKDDLRKRFDPEILVQLYKLIDQLYEHVGELPIESERDPEERIFVDGVPVDRKEAVRIVREKTHYLYSPGLDGP